MSGPPSRRRRPADKAAADRLSPSRFTLPNLGEAPGNRIDGKRLGSMAHALIGDCLQEGLRAPSPVELITRAGRHALAHDARTAYRQAAKQALLTTASVYFRWFAPPPGWILLGVEVPASGCRFDVLWQTPEGVLADELKSETVPSLDALGEHEAQVARLLEAGQAMFPDAFQGIRVIILCAPMRSRLVTAPGRSEPLL
jgi:hypothetical protein